MEPESQRPDLVDPSFPTAVLVVALLAALAGWVVAHRLRHRLPGGPGARAGFFALRVAVATLTIWLFWQCASRLIVLATAWPLPVSALVGGLAVEAAILAYDWERRALRERRGRLLLGLRLAAIAAVLFVLAEPVFSRKVERKIEREVVVLVDDSESMKLVDRQRSVSETLELARFYGVEGAGEAPLAPGLPADFAAFQRDLQAQLGSLTVAVGSGRDPVPPEARDSAAAYAEKAAAEVREAAAAVRALGSDGRPVPGDVAKLVADTARTMEDRLAGGLANAAEQLRSGAPGPEALRVLREAGESANGVASALPEIGRRLDAAYYESLDDGTRAALEEALAKPRSQIAYDVLTRPGAAAGDDGEVAGEVLVDALAERYKVRFVRFGRDVAEVSPDVFLRAGADTSGAIDLEGEPVPAGQLLGPRTEFRAFVPKDGGLPEGWNEIGFNDRGWRRANGPIGFSDDKDVRRMVKHQVDRPMKGKATWALMRYPFLCENPSAFAELAIDARYDDGFIAYLNGREVARRLVPDGEPNAETTATADRVWQDVSNAETIDLTPSMDTLKEGENLFAVQLFNASKDDNDLFFEVYLRARVPVDSEGGGGEADQPFGSRTDIALALEETVENIAPDTLAGVLLVSDGRHNARAAVEDVARRLGVQGAPVGAVAVGSSVGPPDASIIDLQVPESIYLGDKVVARADLRLNGLRGRQVRVGLLQGGEEIDQVELDVPDDRHQAAVRFKHVPEAKGIGSYSVRISPVEGELFPDNNRWEFDVAVTDDRKNVLLVDSFPRWEFRYLRNLFFARDKSVHLQYVLLNEEEIEGVPPLPAVAASASRPFGEAEATRLPESKEEWLKFDAIILGDVPPDVFDAGVWEIIDECVRERGALLTLIAGPRYLPHAFSDERFRDLAPVEYLHSTDTFYEPPEEEYQIALTPEGRTGLIMQQAPSGVVNGQIWSSMPPLRWRHAIEGTKEGADVLAYAEANDPYAAAGSMPVSTAVRPGSDPFLGLFEKRQRERRRALVVTQRYAMGSVCMLLFDRTWRFRYGVGDLYHHRFWGQLLRWGTGENLRAGTEFVRVGTDRLSYLPDEKIKVLARVATRDYRPVVNDDVSVTVYRDGQKIVRAPLRYREASNGIYEAELEPFGQPGRYRVVLAGDEADTILASDGIDELETEFLVAASKNPIELSELTVDRDFLNKTVNLSGGRVVGPGGATELVGLFGEPSKVVSEIVETTLWDTWPVLLFFLGVVTAEWIIRRQGGLV